MTSRRSTDAIVLLLALGLGGSALQAQVPLNLSPSRVIGHPRLRLSTANPNLVEGRELNNPQSVAVDTQSGFIYVADTGNNRVLAWRNASSFENGAMADLVLGQRDFLSTAALGPGTSLASGLFAPTAVAADGQGNVYVADAGNNRILRYPRPFERPDEVRLADLVIGQVNFNSRAANAGGISARTLALSAAAGPFRVGMIFDATGNLWVADAANNRVLRYPAGALGEGAVNGPSANLVLGQPNFTTNATLPLSPATNRLNKQVLRAPSSLALDQGGRLFVADELARVVVYAAPFTSAMDAVRIMGITVVAQGQPPPPAINETSLGLVLANPTRTLPPEGVFTIGNVPFVIDTPAHRILRYDPFDQWPPEITSFSPPARATIGQDTTQQAAPAANRGLAEPTAGSFLTPVSGLFAAGEVFIVDSGNHRILVFPDVSSGPPLSAGAPYQARRVLGQISFEYRSPNLIEGREFQFAGGLISGAGVALDTRSDTPRLYVADTNNHRVLGFADARNVRPGDRADIVIGQPDFFRSVANWPSNSVATRDDRGGLLFPIGIAVDRDGNVWVADSGNGRVLRFPAPFQQQQTPRRPDLVLGQANFTTRLTDATSRTVLAPYGLAFTAEGHLLVSDSAHNRVLLFNTPFSSGMAASRVFGQPDFESIGAGITDNRFNSPRGVATDSDDRLYVCDSANNRVLIFSRAPLAGPDPRAAFTLSRNLRTPLSIYVSALTGEIWVANTAGSGASQAALRYPNFDRLTVVGDASNYAVPAGAPLALALDGFGNLFIADAFNRVAIHFPGVLTVNGANYLPRVAPGLVTTLQSRGLNYTFTGVTRVFNELANPLPLPRELGDLQVLIDDVPAPMYFVSPEQINFLMPMNAPTSGTVELQVVQPSTGRIIAAGQLRMDVASPGLFTANASGTGQLAALNQDGSINSGASRVGRGQIIQLFATGAGLIPNAPPDGSPAEGLVPTEVPPRVFIGAREADVQYSGFAPGLVGVWQINARVPEQTAPSDAVLVVVTMNDIPSNNPQNLNQIRTTIAVQ